MSIPSLDIDKVNSLNSLRMTKKQSVLKEELKLPEVNEIENSGSFSDLSKNSESVCSNTSKKSILNLS